MSTAEKRLTWQGVISGLIIGVLISGLVFGLLLNNVNKEKDRLQIALDAIKKNETGDSKDSPLNNTEKVLAMVISDQANEVLAALKDTDMKRLSDYIHPEKGVRFSPYSYIDLKTNIVLKKEQITESILNHSFHWGDYDGSGAPINLSVKEYFQRFVYDKDYLSVKTVGYNRAIGHGNSINNAFETYPSAIIVEYYFPGTEENSGMDWGSLRLVFDKYGQLWRLIGVIHDQWTI